MSEVESRQIVSVDQEKMDEVVAIVADEERSRADNLVDAYVKGDQLAIRQTEDEMSELNPFWAKFLQPEQHYGISADPLAP
jgi:hypothetical protein